MLSGFECISAVRQFFGPESVPVIGGRVKGRLSVGQRHAT
jgi:hypothetical protein